MPIIIPTIDEIERMEARQRAALEKRVPAWRAAFEQSIALLTAPPKPRRVDRRCGIPSAKYRSRDIADARFLLDRMPLDPDAGQHLADLLEAIA